MITMNIEVEIEVDVRDGLSDEGKVIYDAFTEEQREEFESGLEYYLQPYLEWDAEAAVQDAIPEYDLNLELEKFLIEIAA